MDYKILPNLAKNTENIETFTIEIENKNSKNMLISAVYRPPCGNQSKFIEEIEQVVHNSKNSTKSIFLVGELNLNSLDYASSTPVKNFFNLAFENGIFPVINRSTRVTWASATAIDHILTNTIMDQDLQNGIIKLDISGHFPIFIKKFSLIYDDRIPIKVIEIKTRNLLSPWITKGIKKSSKRKQKLYDKFLKKKSPKNKKQYKDYKQLFEKIKKDFKKKYFQEKLSFYKNDIKNTWKTLKDVIGKTKVNENCLPKR